MNKNIYLYRIFTDTYKENIKRIMRKINITY